MDPQTIYRNAEFRSQVIAAIDNCWGGSEYQGLDETNIRPWLEAQWKRMIGAVNEVEELKKEQKMARTIICNMAASMFGNP